MTLDGNLNGGQGGGYRGNVIYLSTFSKTLAPGLRLGWVIAHPEVIAKLVQAKQGADLHTATFNQVAAYEIAHGGFLDEHIHEIRRIYRERRDAMLAAMDRSFPTEITWTHPEGGLFLWGTLPEHIDAAEVLKTAIEHQVAFVPGEPFHPNGGGRNTMRLNFSNATPEDISTGISRLGEVLRMHLFERAPA